MLTNGVTQLPKNATPHSTQKTQSFLNLFRWDVLSRSLLKPRSCFLWFSFVWGVAAVFKWKMLRDWTSVVSLATSDARGQLRHSITKFCSRCTIGLNFER